MPSAGGQSQVIAEGCKQAADYGAQLRVSVQFPGRLVHRVTFCEQKVKESKRVGKAGSCRPNEQSLVFLGTDVSSSRCHCEWETSRPTKWQQERIASTRASVTSPTQGKDNNLINLREIIFATRVSRCSIAVTATWVYLLCLRHLSHKHTLSITSLMRLLLILYLQHFSAELNDIVLWRSETLHELSDLCNLSTFHILVHYLK